MLGRPMNFPFWGAANFPGGISCCKSKQAWFELTSPHDMLVLGREKNLQHINCSDCCLPGKNGGNKSPWVVQWPKKPSTKGWDNPTYQVVGVWRWFFWKGGYMPEMEGRNMYPTKLWWSFELFEEIFVSMFIVVNVSYGDTMHCHLCHVYKRSMISLMFMDSIVYVSRGINMT